MKNLNILHCDYTLNQNNYQLKIPMNVECIIPKNDCLGGWDNDGDCEFTRIIINIKASLVFIHDLFYVF